MNWYKLSYRYAAPMDFEALFGPDSNGERPRVVERGEPQVREQTLTLYRGFDADIGNLENINGNYVLRPEKCEQGALWFTHDLMSGYDPKEYVQGRGKYVLTYPLTVKRHYQEIVWSDGTTSNRTPDEITNLSEPTENSKYWMGIELPDGFLFSYKTEKFIISEIPINVKPEMIQEDTYELV